MRYLGNKTKLLSFIENVINKYDIEGETFADLFSGTGSVGDYFKDKYKIISNDYMYFSKVISGAKLLNNNTPNFFKFKKKYHCSPFEWLNNKKYKPQDNYYIYHTYTPVGDRMYFTEENAIKIDGFRLDIEELYKQEIIDYKEYLFLLASLLESTLKVSNTSGTYQAFFKFWENRAKKEIIIEPLEFKKVDCDLKNNILYSENTNKLIRKISGDIAYIDPPYTITQYTNSYHILETIARYDYPQIFGKTGRRSKRELSNYSNKQLALIEFEDLFRQLNFKHILLSYSNQSIVPIDEMINLAKKFAKDNNVYVETYNYREYATNNLSNKGNGESLKEIIIYFEKDMSINKSPLNYSGSKDTLISEINKYLPKHIDTFVDAMGGAFNVGANVVATNKVVYNEFNPYIYEIIKMFLDGDKESLVNQVEDIVTAFDLHKKYKESYLELRKEYNETKTPLKLFVLQIYSFQNMIRFNNSQQMNTPVGNNEYCDSIKNRILQFIPKTEKYILCNQSYNDLKIEEFSEDTLFYFDPPYFITKAEYNDGKRGLEGWNVDKETELLSFLTKINDLGYKFILSNVMTHKGKTHHLLKEWIDEHNFNIYEIGQTGIKYPRTEILVTNYKIF